MSSEIFLALIGAATGGLGLKVFEYFAQSQTRGFDAKRAQRDEVVARLDRTEAELRDVRKEAAISATQLARTEERLKYVESEYLEMKEENVKLKARIAELEKK